MNIPKLSQEAEAGSCVAQSILGTCYLDGIDVEIDYGKAFQFYRPLLTREHRVRWPI